jgi:hypothetical protein
MGDILFESKRTDDKRYVAALGCEAFQRRAFDRDQMGRREAAHGQRSSACTGRRSRRPHSRPATSSSWTTCTLTKPVAVRQVIERAGAELRFLPPAVRASIRSRAFSKFKAFLKETAARTVDDLWNAIAEAIGLFTPIECENYFAAAGYDRE